MSLDAGGKIFATFENVEGSNPIRDWTGRFSRECKVGVCSHQISKKEEGSTQ